MTQGLIDALMAEWLPPDRTDINAGHGGCLFHEGHWWTPAEIQAYAIRLLLLADDLERVVKLGQS